MKLYVIPYDWLILENITQKLPIPAQYQERVLFCWSRCKNNIVELLIVSFYLLNLLLINMG